MSAIESMALNRQQIESMNNPEADWLGMTPEQEQFIKAAGANETCLFYGDEILRLQHGQLLAIYEVAFKAAANAAIKLLGATDGMNVRLDMDTPEIGQIFVRVTATEDTGKKAAAIGMVPDPRMH